MAKASGDRLNSVDAVLHRLDSQPFMSPDHAGVVALWRLTRERPEDAIDAAREAISLRVWDMWDELGMALAHYVLGDRTASASHLAKAVAREPQLIAAIRVVPFLVHVQELLGTKATPGPPLSADTPAAEEVVGSDPTRSE